MQLDDDFRRARENHLGAHRDCCLLHIGQHVVASGELEEIVEKPVSTAGVDAAKRSGFTSE